MTLGFLLDVNTDDIVNVVNILRFYFFQIFGFGHQYVLSVIRWNVNKGESDRGLRCRTLLSKPFS